MLLGRSPQIGEIDRLLDDARAGRGRGVLISGEPGIGKTALLGAARARASGMRVIEAVGVEAEANLPFAALGEVAGPLVDHLHALPERQSAAMKGALALGDRTGSLSGDRLAACAGFLGLLRAAAAHQPLLVLIDDAHWLDTSSAECLGYAARRLNGTNVALLAATRPTVDEPPLGGHVADELPLPQLDPDDARALLQATAGDLASTTADALLTAAAGNPLALIELPFLLTDDQRRGAAPFEAAPAFGTDLWQAFARQVKSLGPEVGSAMLVAAASFDRALGPVVLACRDLSIDVHALERAEMGKLVELVEDRIAFAHPLLRAVVYEGAPAGERRRAHAALADHTDPDSRAWHLAAATLGPDAAVADALEEAADRATARGAHGTAADALDRAAALTGQGDARTTRLFAAGLAAAMGGEFARSVALLESAADAADADNPLMRAAVLHLLAMVTLVGGVRSAIGNHAMLTEEADRVRPIDADLAAAMHADAGVNAAVGGDCRLVLESAERAVAVLPDDASATTRCQVFSILGMGLALRGRTDEAREALDAAGDLLDQVDPLSPAAQSISFALHARLCTGQEQRLHADARRLTHAADAADSAGLLPYYELIAADSAYRLGDWEVAEADADEALAVAEHCGQNGPLSIALVVRARIHAARGEEDRARALAALGVVLARPPGYGSTVIWAHAMLGFLELGLGRTREAIRELEECARLSEIAGLEDPVMVPWAPDLVEACVQAGLREHAEHVAAEYGRRVDRTGGTLGRALAARCRGLTTIDDFDREFAAALELHETCPVPLEHARTLLAYGSRLHRARRRVDARERLREALEIFERIGASLWAQRARAELRAAGAVERTAVVRRDELTAQEARVAMSVARGSTNREVAAELFLSPKTVEFHLGRVFRKLGIRSRTELAVLVAEGGAGLEPDPAVVQLEAGVSPTGGRSPTP